MSLKQLFITHKLASILICATVGVTAVGGAGYGIYAANKNNETAPTTNEVVEEEVSTETEEVPTVQETNKNTEDVTTSTSSEKKEEVKKEETAVKSDEKKTEETTKKQEEEKTSDTAKTDTSKKNDTAKKQETSSNSQTSSTTSSNKTSTDTKKSETKKDTTASAPDSSTKNNDSQKYTYHTEVEHHDAVYETVEWQEWVPPVTHTETRTIEFDREIYNTETLNINGGEYPPGTYVTGYEHVVAGTYEEPVEDVPGYYETKTEQQKVKSAYDEYYTVCDQTGSRTLDRIVNLD